MDVESHEISLDFMPESSKNELNSKMYLIATIPFREINKVIY